jgi:hypothetical protein
MKIVINCFFNEPYGTQSNKKYDDKESLVMQNDLVFTTTTTTTAYSSSSFFFPGKDWAEPKTSLCTPLREVEGMGV